MLRTYLFSNLDSQRKADAAVDEFLAKYHGVRYTPQDLLCPNNNIQISEIPPGIVVIRTQEKNKEQLMLYHLIGGEVTREGKSIKETLEKQLFEIFEENARYGSH